MFSKSNKVKKIHKLLKLDKPLVIFDVETTGPNISNDKIVEVAYLKSWGNGMTKIDDIFLNPEIKISSESFALHGISNKSLENSPKFRDKARELWEVFNGSYYSGYSIINFDLPILRREFLRVGMDLEYDYSRIVDSNKIFHYMEPKNLAAAYQHYCRKDFKKGHRALFGVNICLDILSRQIENYEEVMNMDFLSQMYQVDMDVFRDNAQKFYWEKGKIYFAFSKYRNKSLSWVAEKDPKFLEWILSAEFSEKTKHIIREALKEVKE